MVPTTTEGPVACVMFVRKAGTVDGQLDAPP